MGSPEFAATIFRAMIGKVDLVGVVTQPDRPAGRGKVLTPPPVKLLAQEQGIPVLQPERLRKPEAFSELEGLQPNLIIVAAFGQILRQNVLDLPKYGCINVHASLLPRWRGAAPIQAALLHGDAEAGITIMKMDTGVDTGPMYAQRAIPILGDDDAGSLSDRLAQAGAALLLETLPEIISESVQPIPQDNDLATYAPMLKKEDGQLEFSEAAQALVRKVKAFNPWPGTFFSWEGQTIKVLRAKYAPETVFQQGQRGVRDGMPAVGTPDGDLVLLEVQPAGKKAMPGKVFLNGARNWAEITTKSRRNS